MPGLGSIGGRLELGEVLVESVPAAAIAIEELLVGEPGRRKVHAAQVMRHDHGFEMAEAHIGASPTRRVVG
jgi:hypothetical protein